MMVAIYAADMWCDGCAEDIRRQIALEIWKSPKPRTFPDGSDDADFETLDDLDDYLRDMDERYYDSDDYPKWCSDDNESDSPGHCAASGDCVNAFDGIGCFFGNRLTSYGNDYVIESVNEARISGGDNPVVELWANYYDYLEFVEPCVNCESYDHLNEDDLCEDCEEHDD